MVLLAITLWVLGTLAMIVGYILIRGQDQLTNQGVHLGLTIGLSYFLYRGAVWARWITVALTALLAVALAILSGVFVTLPGWASALGGAIGHTAVLMMLTVGNGVSQYFGGGSGVPPQVEA